MNAPQYAVFFSSAIGLASACSYDFGGTNAGGAGPTGASNTAANASGQTVTSVTSVTNGIASTVAPASGQTVATVDVASSSTGMGAPVARCGIPGDAFDTIDGARWTTVSAVAAAGVLGVSTIDAQIFPFEVGGVISNDKYPMTDCALAVEGLGLLGAQPAVAAADDDGHYVGISYDGANVIVRFDEGAGAMTFPAAAAGTDRLAVRFVPGNIRFYAGNVLVREIPAAGWLGSPTRIFAGAVEDGQASVATFNPQLYEIDLPPP